MSEDKRVDSTVNMTGDTNVDNSVDNAVDTDGDSVHTIARAATILGVSEDWVRRMVKHGIITASPRIVPSDAHNHEHNNEHSDGDGVLITARELRDYQARHEAAMQAYHEDTAHIDENKLWAIEDTLRAMDDAAIITSEDLKALTDILNS